MDLLFRKVRKSPQVGKSSKHSKLGEGWEENREAISEGVTFYLKHLGSTLLDELPIGESYGDGVSSKAVQRIVDMAKALGKKLQKVAVKVNPTGIHVLDMDTKKAFIDVSIYRISFCTADKSHDNVFAFIARNTINETMECHAFLCAKSKIAQAVTLSVSQAFMLATDRWNTQNQKSQTQALQKSNKEDGRLGQGDINLGAKRHLPKISSAPTISVLADSHPRLPKPGSKPNLSSLEDQTSRPQHRSKWQTFGEEDGDNNIAVNETLDDCFSQLAENRSRQLSMPTFSTDLRQEDLDDGVTDYMDGAKCFEAFSRQKSLEDLLNI